MAEPLKYMYSPAFFETLGPTLKEAIPGFDCKEFTYAVFDKSWPDLELKQRVSHISKCLGYFLPGDFTSAAETLITLSNQMISKGIHTQSFAPIFIPEYIQANGLDYPDESLNALTEITRLVSAEFAIRPFLNRYPKKTMDYMLQLSTHSHASVRRFSSEGCRPRLPWGAGVPWLKKNPAMILAVLENLKTDASEYVRKSVANNLNDISKDHPELVLNLAQNWRQERHASTDWIIRRACRTLLKRGDTDALSLHGFDPKHRSEVRNFRVDRKMVKVGSALEFHFDFVNKQKEPSSFRIEYAIDYKTSTGKTSRKIFKLKEGGFEPGILHPITKKQSFKDLTTRRHYKGSHQISILSNGKSLATTEFTVC